MSKCLECSLPVLEGKSFCSRSCSGKYSMRALRSDPDRVANLNRLVGLLTKERLKDPYYKSRCIEGAKKSGSTTGKNNVKFATAYNKTPEARANSSKRMKLTNSKYGHIFAKLSSERAFKRLQDKKDNFGYHKIKKYEYGGVRMRSSWEVRFAQMCDERKIKWSYEEVKITLTKGSWLPDFFLPERNLIVEIKPFKFKDKLLSKISEVTVNYQVLDISEFKEFFNA